MSEYWKLKKPRLFRVHGCTDLHVKCELEGCDNVACLCMYSNQQRHGCGAGLPTHINANSALVCSEECASKARLGAPLKPGSMGGFGRIWHEAKL